MRDTDKMRDQAAVIGVCPYSDGCGFQYSVLAEMKDSHVTIQITSPGGEIEVDQEHWQFIKEAVGRALGFVQIVGDDR